MPPPLTFAFEYEMTFILYGGGPIVELVIGFEFTVTVELGFNLDTKGIREAIAEKAPLKAFNSFALIDSLNGVDFAMITATALVRLAVDVSAVIVKVGVEGSLIVKVTVDLFDAYPETSRGLVRPFELLSIGSNPLEWFEFNLRLFVRLKLYVKIGFYAGFVKITLFKYGKLWGMQHCVFCLNWPLDTRTDSDFMAFSSCSNRVQN